MKKIFTLATITVVSLASCKKDSGPYIKIPTGVPTNPVSFSKDIQPIFTIHCVGCHDEMHVTGLGLAGTGLGLAGTSLRLAGTGLGKAETSYG